MRIVTDMVEFCARELPRWHPISISGYHIREAGSTAQQELAFTLADGFAYVQAAIDRGLAVDDFAPRLSFFFNAHIDFFEEIAKYRAARRIWAREMRETFGARDPASWRMRFHSQTAGVSLTAQQPLNNVVRTALEALSAVLGGTQSLHTNSYDEALALPDRGRGAPRAAHPADHRPRDRRHEHDRPARRQLLRRGADRPHGAGGLRLLPADRASSAGWSRRSSRTSRSARSRTPPGATRRRSTRARALVVGVNRYEQADEEPIEILRIDPALERKQIGRLQATRARRDGGCGGGDASTALKEAAADPDRNLMDPIIDCARARVQRGRDGRGAAGGVRQLHGDAGFLASTAAHCRHLVSVADLVS